METAAIGTYVLLNCIANEEAWDKKKKNDVKKKMVWKKLHFSLKTEKKVYKYN